jgi:uncharacterized repeat protein (TIGR01451 family)
VGVVVVLAALTAGSGVAWAAPLWQIAAVPNSTAAPGSTLDYRVEIRNAAGSSAEGSVEPIKFTGTLPPGLTIESVTMVSATEFSMDCSGVTPGAQTFTCESSETLPTQAENGLQYYKTMLVRVNVEPGAQGVLTSRFEIAGGDPSPPSASTVATATITDEAPVFGISAFDAPVSADAAGSLFTQAGGHPYAQTTTVNFNTYESPEPLKGDLTPVEATKDVEVQLPPGFVGDPHGVGQCTLAQLSHSSGQLPEPSCPVSSQVGTTIVRSNSLAFHTLFGPIPVFNMQPPSNAPARLGFNVSGVVVVVDVTVRSGGDYGLTAHASNISEALAIAGTTLTLWGVPADPVHDSERACPGDRAPWEGFPTCSSGAAQTAFLRNPTSCGPAGVGLATSVRADSWVHPGAYTQPKTVYSHKPNGYPYPESEWGAQEGITGCDKVPFNPEMSVTPDTAAAGVPAGYTFDLSMPQSDEPGTIDQSDVRRIELALPAGVQINPSSAAGLEGCSEAQVALHSESEASCPPASKLAAVSVKAPALENPLSGGLYLATPYANPAKSLVAVYLIASGSGVTVKLPGAVRLDPATGQATAVFDETPQLPFSDVHVELKDGSRAAFTNPATCGGYEANATLSGWSGAGALLKLGFSIEHGADGGACAAPGFAPSLVAGTVSPRAGAFSPFVLSFARTDSEQQITGLTDTFPPGVSAVLKGVARCSDADVKAAESETGGCPQASRVGSVTVGAGSGPDPYFLKGSVYFTGPYNNGPFGEVVVVPAVAGPFNLGDVVVRGSIRVDPKTAQATVVSDPFPLFVKNTGIPADVRRVDVSVDRPGFTFNPTNCNELQATGTLSSAQGASERVSSRFQAADCANLAFHPRFTASTQGKTSRREGASLDVKVGFKAGQANIAKVKVSLPRALPSRLDTLKLACTDAVFQANPAACPAASRVGAAVARTPILPVPITGPAYIVSHGGAAFPDLEMVLQGEGVTLVLDGHTDISQKTNITTSTFDAVPDVPVSSFELKLPEGAHSVLGAPGGALCGKTLTMPTTLTGQNGAVLRQATPVNVTGCKPAIRVVGHTVKGSQASIRVTVPSAGTLVAGGTGIGRSVQHARGAQVVTIGVTLGQHDRQVLAKNPRQRVNAKVTLRFKPKRGAPLTAYVSLLMG